MQVIKKTQSIYFQLAAVLVAALAVAAFTFGVLNITVSDYVCRKIVNSDYVVNKDIRHIQSLQEYADKYDISMYDIEALDKWGEAQDLNFFDVYAEDMWIYTGMYSPKTTAETLMDYYSKYGDSGNYYPVNFADGTADVYVYGAYASKIDNYILIAEFILSLIVFLGISMTAIRRIITYICTLKNEIEILEGGNLEYQITVAGSNELSELAAGLDKMRKSFAQQIETEKNLINSNRQMITEMSHDLRTPLTNLMLYLEILRLKKYRDEDQMNRYIDKAADKAGQLKQISDSLFEHITRISMEISEPYARHPFRDVLYDVISEMTEYLSDAGFEVKAPAEWEDTYITADIAGINRITGNITSNIIKYAEPEFPVVIDARSTGVYTGLKFSNRIKATGKAGSGIGIKSIQHLMNEMGGCMYTEEKDGVFSIYIGFR